MNPSHDPYQFSTVLAGDTHIFQSGLTSDFDPLKPGGRKKLFTHADRHGVLKLIASPDGRDGSLPIQQDVCVYSTFMAPGDHLVHGLDPGRKAWLHVVKGKIRVNGLQLQTGDGLGFSDEDSIMIMAQEPSEILLFDLAKVDVKKTKKELQRDSFLSPN